MAQSARSRLPSPHSRRSRHHARGRLVEEEDLAGWCASAMAIITDPPCMPDSVMMRVAALAPQRPFAQPVDVRVSGATQAAPAEAAVRHGVSNMS